MIDPTLIAAGWGAAGAFGYAFPKWLACVITASRTPGGSSRICALEAVGSVIIGAIAAAAFGEVALTFLHIEHHKAVSTFLGLCANRAAPLVVESASGVVSGMVSGLASRVLPPAPPKADENE